MKEKIDSIGVLRTIACLMVVIVHAPLSETLLSSWIRNLSETTSYFAIFLFFLISGFVLGKGFLAGKYKFTLKGIGQFYWKRIKRIAPVYYLVVFYLFFNTPIDVKNRTDGLFHYLSFSASPDTYLYSSGYLWFISTLIQLYLLSPIGFMILNAVKKSNFRIRLVSPVIIMTIGIMFTYWLAGLNITKHPYAYWFTNIHIFFTGMLLNNIIEILKTFINKFSSAIHTFIFFGLLMLLGIIYITISRSVHFAPQLFNLNSYVIIPILATLFLIAFLIFLPRFLSWGALAFIGGYSYEVYLLHQPVFSYLNLSCNPYCDLFLFSKNIMIVLFVSLLITIFIKKGSKLLFHE